MAPLTPHSDLDRAGTLRDETAETLRPRRYPMHARLRHRQLRHCGDAWCRLVPLRDGIAPVELTLTAPKLLSTRVVDLGAYGQSVADADAARHRNQGDPEFRGWRGSGSRRRGCAAVGAAAPLLDDPPPETPCDHENARHRKRLLTRTGNRRELDRPSLDPAADDRGQHTHHAQQDEQTGDLTRIHAVTLRPFVRSGKSPFRLRWEPNRRSLRMNEKGPRERAFSDSGGRI